MIEIQNTSNKSLFIEFNLEKTVWELKQMIYSAWGPQFLECKQMLVHAGVIMEDDQKLTFYDVNEGNLIVVLPADNDVDNQLLPLDLSKGNVVAWQEYYNNAEIKEKERIVDYIEAMGFNLELVDQAMIACSNNPDLAVEYLIKNKNTKTKSQIQEEQICIMDKISKQIHEILKIFPKTVPGTYRDPTECLIGEPLEGNGYEEAATPPVVAEGSSDAPYTPEQAMEQEHNIPDEKECMTILLSRADEIIIRRLQAGGFSEALAVQAYVACEKNEEKAAEFLNHPGFKNFISIFH